MGAMSSLPWPIQGSIDFVRTPRWWGWPLLALTLTLLLCVAVAASLVWWQIPSSEATWWQTIIGWLWAIALGLGGAVAMWVVFQPMLLALACETLVATVQRAAGAPPLTGEGLVTGFLSSLRVILNTLPLRTATVAVSFLGPLLAGPVGLVLAFIAVSYVAVIDACDVALAVRGMPGVRRLEVIAAHRGELRKMLPVAAGWNFLLGVTVIGWVLWMPGLLVGAARLVLSWPETAPVPDAGPGAGPDTAAPTGAQPATEAS
jgi:hypothetical protein